MREAHDTREVHDDEVIELGAASDLTLGIPDPLLKENFVTPQARDHF
jgi:hypothetical protein